MQTNQETGQETGIQNWTSELRYVARQPIMNLQGRVHGYELLFRNGTELVPSGDGNIGTRTMLDNAVIFGLERFTNGLPAFINCTAEALTENLVDVLSPSLTVLGIPSSLEMTPALIDTCRELKDRGFRLLLDDFTWSASAEPLVTLADYVRVDFSKLSAENRKRVRSPNCGSTMVIAKCVETQDEYMEACEVGFTFFQGDYFCHPVLLKKSKIPANRLYHFDIMRLLHHDPIDLRQVSRLVMRDAALTFRLLRLVNSPLYATHQEIRSIESAILIVGDQTLRRIVSLAILSELNANQPPEILQMALVRARFCELAARLCWLDPAEQYLLGMFSMVSAMLCLPMDEVTPSLPFRDQICEALLGTSNPERTLLTWLELHEHAEWNACDAVAENIGLSREKLNLCYGDAVAWAHLTVSSAA
jgi:c-di-GMP-related signal transduction protein